MPYIVDLPHPPKEGLHNKESQKKRAKQAPRRECASCRHIYKQITLHPGKGSREGCVGMGKEKAEYINLFGGMFLSLFTKIVYLRSRRSSAYEVLYCSLLHRAGYLFTVSSSSFLFLRLNITASPQSNYLEGYLLSTATAKQRR